MWSLTTPHQSASHVAHVSSFRLPGVPATGLPLEIPFTAVVNIRGDRLYHEHISWDQGTVLAQLGLLPEFLPFPYQVPGVASGTKIEYKLPIAGLDTARKIRDRNSVLSNQLMDYKVRTHGPETS